MRGPLPLTADRTCYREGLTSRPRLENPPAGALLTGLGAGGWAAQLYAAGARPYALFSLLKKGQRPQAVKAKASAKRSRVAA